MPKNERSSVLVGITMKILVYGVGGIGGFIGSFLCKTKFATTFLSRGKTFLNLKKNGLKLESLLGNQESRNIQITDNLDDFNEFDIIILSVKLYDLKTCLLNIRKGINRNTIILPFQNGIIAEQLIDEIFVGENNYGAVAQISSFLDNDSKIIHKGKLATFFVGPMDEKKVKNKKLLNFCKELSGVGLDIRYTEKITQKLWDKFIFLSAYSGMTTLTKMTIGEIFENIKFKKMFIEAMNETYYLSKKYGISFEYDPVENWESKIVHMPYDMTSSMYLDFKNNKKLELSWLSGSVVKLCEKFSLKSKIHKEILRQIKLAK